MATFHRNFVLACAASLLPWTQPLLSQQPVDTALKVILGTRNMLAASSNIAISDTANNRALIYETPIHTNENASIVLGQADFVHGEANRGGGPGPNTLRSPSGLARDSNGDLYVADAGNCRVLQFRPPFISGMNASLVIQDANLASSKCETGRSAAKAGLVVLTEVLMDPNGNLWVTDGANSRVLEYEPPFSTSMTPTLVLGDNILRQKGTGSCDPMDQPPTANILCNPGGMALDREGNLWVSDFGNNRLLEFRPPFSTGMAASLEVGQPVETGFVSNLSTEQRYYQCLGASKHVESSSEELIDARSDACTDCIADAFYGPQALAFDWSGNLWVADRYNNRVLAFVPPFSNGMGSSTVLGARLSKA